MAAFELDEFYLLQHEALEFVRSYLTSDDPARSEEKFVAALVLAATPSLAALIGLPPAV